MIRQRLGHVRHDTTGGDVYLRCLPLSFPAIVLKGYLTSCPRMFLGEVTLHDDSYRVVPLWSVYVAVLVTSKTTILRFQMNEGKLKGSSWWTG